MLLALDQEHHRVAADSAPRAGTYVCPGCQKPVILKRGTVMSAHFAHVAGRSCDTFSEGETHEHLRGKQQLADWFRRSGYHVQIEAPLRQLHQRPDLLVRRADQAPLAIEFQCSPLSEKRLAERTRGYWQHGYRVLWLLGRPYRHGVHLHGKALKFVQASTGWGCFVPLWNVNTATLDLKYQLLTLDSEPLMMGTHAFNSHQLTVDQVLTTGFKPPVAPQTAAHFQRYQRMLTFGRLRRGGCQRDLQLFCYQHGGSLQQLPGWVLPVVARPPVLRTPWLVWYLNVFVRLTTHVGGLTVLDLHHLLWQTLRPLLAPVVCIRHRPQLLAGIVQQLIKDLVRARVLIPGAVGYTLNPAQLQWINH